MQKHGNSNNRSCTYIFLAMIQLSIFESGECGSNCQMLLLCERKQQRNDQKKDNWIRHLHNGSDSNDQMTHKHYETMSTLCYSIFFIRENAMGRSALCPLKFVYEWRPIALSQIENKIPVTSCARGAWKWHICKSGLACPLRFWEIEAIQNN